MTDMTPREAVEVLRRALQRFDSDGLHGLAEEAERALATLSALVDRAGEPVAAMQQGANWPEPAWFGDIPPVGSEIYAIPPPSPGESHDR